MEWTPVKKQINLLSKDDVALLSIYRAGNEFILCSTFDHPSNKVQYITSLDKIKQYLRNEITLKELYLDAEDLMLDIMKTSDNMPGTNKEYLAENIDYGACLYSEVPEELKNPDSWKYIYYLDE